MVSLCILSISATSSLCHLTLYLTTDLGIPTTTHACRSEHSPCSVKYFTADFRTRGLTIFLCWFPLATHYPAPAGLWFALAWHFPLPGLSAVWAQRESSHPILALPAMDGGRWNTVLPSSVNHRHSQLNFFENSEYLHLWIPSCFHDYLLYLFYRSLASKVDPFSGGRPESVLRFFILILKCIPKNSRSCFRVW